MIAAILDPGGRCSAPEALLRRAGARATGRSGPLWLGWTQAPPTVADGVTVLVDSGPGGRHHALAAAARGRAPQAGVTTGVAWAAAERRGAAVRDVTGERPLFVCRQGDVTYVASELRELLALLTAAPAVDHEAGALWLAMEPLGQRTLYTGVAPVPAGHWLTLGAARAQRYWEPAPQPLDLDPEAAADRLWAALRAAVEPHVRAADRPAVRLSGGLDSTAVLAATAELDGAAPVAFSTLFPGYRDADESELIAATASRLRTPSRTFAAGPRALLDDGTAFLERWGVPQEYPGRGLFHEMLVAAAAQHDVVLDGEGGDELFGCEPYLLADLVRRGDLRAARRVAHRLPGAPERLSGRAYRVLARRWVVGGAAPAILRPPARAAPELDWFAETLTPRARAAVQARRTALDWRTRPGPRWLARRRSLIVERPAEAGSPDYLRRVAVMAGAAGASPLTDPRLIEVVLSLPPEHAFDRGGDKALLRAALAGRVPDAVRLRPDKAHFGDPVLDSLDVAALLERLTPDLAPYLDVAQLRRQVQSGPDAHPRGVAGWLFESWRAAMFATWLRR